MTRVIARVCANTIVATLGAVIVWLLFIIHDVAWNLPR